MATRCQFLNLSTERSIYMRHRYLTQTCGTEFPWLHRVQIASSMFVPPERRERVADIALMRRQHRFDRRSGASAAQRLAYQELGLPSG
jgi:hypothetical protein